MFWPSPGPSGLPYLRVPFVFNGGIVIIAFSLRGGGVIFGIFRH